MLHLSSLSFAVSSPLTLRKKANSYVMEHKSKEVNIQCTICAYFKIFVLKAFPPNFLLNCRSPYGQNVLAFKDRNSLNKKQKTEKLIFLQGRQENTENTRKELTTTVQHQLLVAPLNRCTRTLHQDNRLYWILRNRSNIATFTSTVSPSHTSYDQIIKAVFSYFI